jgi:hypothetical protein
LKSGIIAIHGKMTAEPTEPMDSSPNAAVAPLDSQIQDFGSRVLTASNIAGFQNRNEITLLNAFRSGHRHPGPKSGHAYSKTASFRSQTQTAHNVLAHLNLFAIQDASHSCVIPVLAASPCIVNDDRAVTRKSL